MRVLAIIPAKLDSKRLVLKNVQEVNGKTLIELSIDYAKQSKHDIDILVSSESEIVRNIAKKNGVLFHLRSKEFCGDTEVVDVYINILNEIVTKYDLVVGLQPDHPDRDHTLDECINYMIDSNYDDLITINQNYERSGSVRIFKYDYIVHGSVSKRIGCLKDCATDVHYESDLYKVGERLRV